MICRHARSGPRNLLLVVCAGATVVDVLEPQSWTLPGLQTWATVFVAICLQAAPFVVLGTLLAALVTVLPMSWMQRRLSRRTLVAVPMLGLAGAAMPGCECGSVPTASAMVRRGTGIGPAIAFMVSAPGTNPVVLTATAAAFPGQPRIVAARLAAGLMVAIGAGYFAARGTFGRPRRADAEHAHSHANGWLARLAGELGQALGLLTVGAAAAAALIVWIPRDVLAGTARHSLLSVLVLAALATVLCVCSQADAFIARSFVGFSRTAQLAFMVVGPAVDAKLAAMQAGAFGARFTARFCAVTLLLAVTAAWLASVVLL